MAVSAVDRAERIKAILRGHEPLSILAGVEARWLAQDDGAEAEDGSLAAAIIAALSGRHDVAVRRFDAALADSERLGDEALGEAYYLLSRSLAALGEQGAASAVAEFEANRPLNFVAFLHQMAFGFHQMNRVEHAKRGYARMVRANPLNLGAVVNLGILLQQDGDAAALKDLFERYDRAGGADRHVGILAARASLAFPDWSVLQRLISRMVSQNPHDAELWQASFTILSNANAPLAAAASARRAAELEQSRRFLCFRRYPAFNA